MTALTDKEIVIEDILRALDSFTIEDEADQVLTESLFKTGLYQEIAIHHPTNAE